MGSPALISVLSLFHRLDLKNPYQYSFSCHGSPSVAPDFLWLCSRELSCLFWKWWVVLCGFMTGRQMLKCSVVRPQNLPGSFLHWVISLLHPGCFQAFPCHPSLFGLFCLLPDFFVSDLEEGLLRFLSFFFPLCIPSTWKHLSVASHLCGGIIVQVSARVLPPLLGLTEKLLNTFNAQKFFLSAIRLVTGFVGASCHQ